jgi:hypothetical protein
VRVLGEDSVNDLLTRMLVRAYKVAIIVVHMFKSMVLMSQERNLLCDFERVL